MSNIKRMKDKDGNYIYPVTHASAVFDDEGNTIEDKIAEVEADLEGLHAKDDEFSSQLTKAEDELEYKANKDDDINVLNPPFPLIGVVLDGRDNTEEIKLILDYCVSNKRRAYFPAGTYLMNLIIEEGFVDIVGDNPRATIFKAFNDSNPTLSFIGKGPYAEHISWISISNLQIRGDYDSTNGVSCLELHMCSKVIINNVELYRGLEHDGLKLFEVYDSVFKTLSIGECGNYDNTTAGLTITNSSVDCSNRLRFYDMHAENCKTTVILDGTLGEIPNNTITFENCHLEGRGYPPTTSLKQYGVFVRGGNNSLSFRQCDFTYYEKGIVFESSFYGFAELISNYFSYALTNSIIVDDISHNSVSNIKISNNHFLLANDSISINSNVNMNNILFTNNRGRVNDIGGYKINDTVVYDDNVGLIATNSYNAMSLNNKKGNNLLNIDSLGGISNPSLSGIIEAGSIKKFVLAQTGNVNGRGIFLMSFGMYGDAYAIGYSRGDTLYSIAIGTVCTMSTTDLATDGKLNIYLDSNGILAVNNLTSSNVSCVVHLIPAYVCL